MVVPSAACSTGTALQHLLGHYRIETFARLIEDKELRVAAQVEQKAQLRAHVFPLKERPDFPVPRKLKIREQEGFGLDAPGPQKRTRECNISRTVMYE